MSSLILRRIFSVTFSSNREKTLTAVLNDPAIQVSWKLNCITELNAFHNAGRFAFVWRNRVTDLISVRTIVGFIASHLMCATLEKGQLDCQKFFQVDYLFE